MEELYLYEMNKFNVYLNNRNDCVVFVQNIKTGRKILLSKTNNLSFIYNEDRYVPLSRIIIFSRMFESINIVVTIAIPFYSKNILKKLINTFSNVYLITNFPSNKNTSGIFSILIPNIKGLEFTVKYIQKKIQSNVCLNFKIIKSGFVHIYDKTVSYESCMF